MSLMNTFDRKIAENFTRLVAGVQNDFQSKLDKQSAELVSVQNGNNKNQTFITTFDKTIAENFTKLLASIQNDFQSKIGNLSAELMSIQKETKNLNINCSI